jgi:hypothetical protein
MLSNNISKQIEKISFFNRAGIQSITIVSDARKLVATIPLKDRTDPSTTYQDRQCGTGLDALVLAEQLMIDLKDTIPNEQDRLTHIFKNQIFLSDINVIQARIARANIICAVGDRTFDPNVTMCDCFNNNFKTTYTFGSIDFDTTNEFIEHYLNISEHVIVITKSNSHRYVESKLTKIDSYQFLRRVKMTPMCIVHVPKNKKNKKVKFISGKTTVVIDDPKTVPTEDASSFKFVQEVLKIEFEGYRSEAGPEDNAKFNPSSGSVPIVFRDWLDNVVSGRKLTTSYNKQNKVKILMISDRDVTDKMGYGVPKLMVPKNGNPGRVPNFYYDAKGELACSAQVHWIAMSKEEFNKITSAIKNEPCYNILFKSVLVKTHTKDFWSKIPKIKYLSKVKEIYDKHYKSDNS